MYRQTLRRLLSILVLITAASALAVVPQVARTPAAFANVLTGGSACGVLTAYLPATSLSAGQIVIGNTAFPIAPGTTLSGSPSFLLGSSVCLTPVLNASGQIIGGTLSTNATGPISVCGAFGGFTAASASTLGSIIINGQTIPIGLGVVLAGSTALAANTAICLSGTVNAAGQLIAGSVTQTALGPVNVCGTVTAYTLSTATTAGSITIGGQTYGIAPGVTLGGASLLSVSANPSLCLQASLNGLGQIAAGSVGTALGGAPTVNVCGMVTTYTAATASTGGTITVAGNTLVINAGAVFVGAAQPSAGTAVCLALVVNSSGAIVGGTVVTTATGIPLSATLVTPSGALRNQAIRE